jgi:hypothetical protein
MDARVSDHPRRRGRRRWEPLASDEVRAIEVGRDYRITVNRMGNIWYLLHASGSISACRHDPGRTTGAGFSLQVYRERTFQSAAFGAVAESAP